MPQPSSRVCSIDNCGRRHTARGWCQRHYNRWQRHGDPLVVNRFIGTTEERFWHYVDQRSDGHWIWTGPSSDPTNPAHNYGRLYDHDLGWSVLAHRWAWERFIGPIPDGQEIDHVCRTTLCVRPHPEHLEPVTHLVNIIRGESPAAQHARKTECPAGHQYSFRPDGRRFCRECTAERLRIKMSSKPPGPGTGSRNRDKTHCVNGHEFTEDNTYRPPGRAGSRQCRTCTGRRPASESQTHPRRKTHCVNGHSMTGDNVKLVSGRTRCVACDARRTEQRREQRQAARPPGPAGNAAKTHCKRGHPLSGDNLYVQKTGARSCLTCKRAKSLEAYYRTHPCRQ